MNNPSYITVELLRRAQKLVRESVLYGRFIDGTPLENDIAVWMADFAGEVLHESRADSGVSRPPVAQEPNVASLKLMLKESDQNVIDRDEQIAELQGEIERLKSRPPVAGAWQPIETAPKDGTDVLLCWFDGVAAPMFRTGHNLGGKRRWQDTHAWLHNEQSWPNHQRERLFFVGHADGNRESELSVDAEVGWLQRYRGQPTSMVAADGFSSHLAQMRAFGDAIVPQVAQVAQVFIEAYMSICAESGRMSTPDPSEPRR